MYLYNTLTRKKEEFKSIEPGKVKMYTCGPTVYHYAHIGNLRSYIMEDILEKYLRYDGYDVNLTFDTKDPSKPLLILEDGQVIGDEYAVFGIAWGDGKILAQTTPATSAPSTFNSCQKFASLYVRVYVNDLSTLVGNVGDLYNILEWLSKEEAEDLMKEGV